MAFEEEYDIELPLNYHYPEGETTFPDSVDSDFKTINDYVDYFYFLENAEDDDSADQILFEQIVKQVGRDAYYEELVKLGGKDLA